MEGLIQEESEECISSMKKALKATSDSVVSINDKFGVSLINILWAIAGGKRYKHDDEEFKVLLKVIQSSLRAGNPAGNFVVMLPWLRHLPYFKKEFKELTSGTDALCEMLERTIEEHKRTWDPSTPRDLIDVYLQAMEDNKNDPNSTFFSTEIKKYMKSN